jgi:hypothetical protein
VADFEAISSRNRNSIAYFGLKHHHRKKRGVLPENEAATGLAGQEFSAGLIFLCFVSFYLTCPEHLSESGPALKQSNSGGKELKRSIVPLPGIIKIFTFLIY